MVGYLGSSEWMAAAEIFRGSHARHIRQQGDRALWLGERSRKLSLDIQSRALAKLAMIDAAETLDDLRNPPSNRLHDLSGDRAGQHSVSINMQWRICFVWKGGSAYDVEIVDYH